MLKVGVFAKRLRRFFASFIGLLCAHGGSKRPNLARLKVTNLLFETSSVTLSSAVRHGPNIFACGQAIVYTKVKTRVSYLLHSFKDIYFVVGDDCVIDLIPTENGRPHLFIS